MVCDYADCSSDDEVCWWLGTDTDDTNDSPSVHCRTNAGRMVEMKINEFINKANHNDEIVVNRCDSLIRVYDNENDLLFRIPLDATNFLGIDWFTSANDFISKETSKYLSELIEEFLKTPIEDRAIEKRYRLVAKRKIDQMPKYVKKIITGFDEFIIDFTNLKSEAIQYNDSDLKVLAEREPILALAIDLMKEPVEEE